MPHVLALCAAAPTEVQAEAADVLKVLARSPQCAALIRAHNGVAALEALAAINHQSKARTCALKALHRLAEQPGSGMGAGAAPAPPLQPHGSLRSGGSLPLPSERTGQASDARGLVAALQRSTDTAAQMAAMQAAADSIRDDPTCTQCASNLLRHHCCTAITDPAVCDPPERRRQCSELAMSLPCHG